MADYCYLPPFVTDPNTPPNIMIVYEKGKYSLNRAYSTTYTSSQSYYGFFDSSVGTNYSYNTSKDWFEKPTTACTPNGTNNCLPGNVLNWALMSSVDVDRKAIAGFGWPKAVSSEGAGDVFTYKGCFRFGGTADTCASCADTSNPPAGCTTPRSHAQWKDKDADSQRVSATLDTNGDGSITASDYTYSFCLKKATGSPPTTEVTIKTKLGLDAPACTGACPGCTTLVNDEKVIMRYTDEKRTGIFQKYADKDQNYVYDSDAPRFGLRRWKTSTSSDERNRDILCDCAAAGNPAGCTASGSCTDTSKATLFQDFLNVISKEPAVDKDDPDLGYMEKDIIKYFSGDITAEYDDRDSAYTQTAYNWSTDPAKSCRKSFTLYITTGVDLTESGTALTMPAACTSLDATLTSAFAKNACYGFNTDLYTADGGTFSPLNKWQNLRNYVVHTKFYATGGGNAAKLEYASKTVGGGDYLAVEDPAELETKIEEAILNILSTSASASTVATLTTQSRESSTLTQAYFYPKREGTPLKWIGYLRLLWSDGGANLREDTKNSGWLDLKNDNILSFYYDSTAVAYKARTYADTGGDLKIDSASCTPTATKLNDNVLAIWNAQSKLLSRSPDESDSDKRNIKIGIGNTAGVVTSSQMYDFTTAQNSTLQPFWNYASYCSNVTSRWCATGNDCNYCNINTSRTCPGRANSECYYCSGNTALSCPTVGASGAGSYCYFDYSPCGTTTPGFCDGSQSRACTVAADCIDNYGTCTTDICDVYNTDEAAIAGVDTFTCNADCDSPNCATSVIKFVRGFDKPTPAGSSFRIRSQCTADTDCPGGGSCSSKVCSSTGVSCSPTDNCASVNPGDVCVGTCSASSTNVLKTLKLGDIVYSTPRISPNSAVNGYDVTYKDTTYSAFVNSRIKGKCSTNTTCPNTSDNTSSVNESCTSNVCTNDGYTPIVIVGANDGMVHAFKVSKIKDFSPAEDDCGGQACDSITTGYQTAAFVDKPNTALGAGNLAPPADLGKELWSYIPYNAVPYLRWYCSESYCHIPMLDARFTVIDASIDYDRNGTIASEATEAAGGSPTTKRCPDASTSGIGACDCEPKVSGNCNYPWRRLLVGAMGAGGKQITVGSNTFSSSVFVLDITNSASPKLLWERPLPDGTLTTSTPAIVRLVNSTGTDQTDKNGKWYVVIGSGPTAVGTNTVSYKTSNARIFVFDLRTGENMTKGADGTDMTSDDGIDIGASGVAVGDMLAVDMDSDYQVDAIYFGTYGGTGAAGKGKLYRLTLRNDPDVNTKSYQTTPSSWALSTAVVPGGGSGRPIFASPEIAQDPSDNKWIYFGTGVYLSAEHATSPAPDEYLYGFKESAACWKGITASCSGYPSTGYTNFLDATNITITGAQATELGCFCAGNLMNTISCSPAGTCSSCGAGLDTVVTKVTNATLTDVDGVTTCDTTDPTGTAAIDCLTTQINSSTGCSGLACNGWKRTITAQKSFSKPFVAGGLANYTSFVPQSTSCSLGGSTRLWSLHYTTGTAYVQPTIFACDAAGCSTATTGLTINASISLGTGVPPLGESLVALPLSGDTYKVITQVSGGLPGTSMAPSLPAKSGYVLWIVK